MNIFAKMTVGLLIAGLSMVAAALDEPPDGLIFDNAWVRAMPPGMKMTAAYGTLRNTGDLPIELTTFSCSAFGDVSLHRTELVDGETRMRTVVSMVIPAGGELVLAPGGYHLMLMQPSGSAEPGDTVSLQATASDGQTFSFVVPVVRK